MKRLAVLLLFLMLLPMPGQIYAQCGSGSCGPGGCQIPGSAPPSTGWRSASPPGAVARRPLIDLPANPITYDIPDAVADCRDSIVKIRAGEWGGSGTYIGDGLVITCEHVCRGASEVKVYFPTGEEMTANVIAAENGSDLAVVQLVGTPPHTARGVPVCTTPAATGERIFAAGYGPDNTLVCVPGSITDLSKYTMAVDTRGGGRVWKRPTAEATGHSLPGDSGGAWITEDGHLRAVLWGGRPGENCVTATTEYCEWLRGVCNGIRRPFPPPVTPPTPPFDPSPLQDRIGKVEVKVGDLDVLVGRLAAPPPPPIEEPVEEDGDDGTTLLILSVVAGIITLLVAGGIFFAAGGGNT